MIEGLRRTRLRGQVSRSLSSRISTKEKKINPACGRGQKAKERHLQTGKEEGGRLQGGAPQTDSVIIVSHESAEESSQK